MKPSSPNVSPKSQSLTPTSPILNVSHPDFTADDEFDEIALNDLKDDQRKIDSSLKFLLNYKGSKRPIRESVRNINKGTSSKEQLAFPDSISPSLKKISDVNELHAGVLLDYLMKVNKFNKILLDRMDDIANKYNSLVEKLENKNIPSTPCHLAATNVSTATGESNSNLEQRNLELELKVDELQQQNYSNVVLCQGSIIETIDQNNVKNDIVEKLKLLDNTVSSNDIDKVTFIGKTKKSIKIICSNSTVKSKIIKKSKEKKINNLYFSDFLTPLRSKLHYNLRQLKKNYPNRIKSVYIRFGKIYYKLDQDTEFLGVRSTQDLEKLLARLQEST